MDRWVQEMTRSQWGVGDYMEFNGSALAVGQVFRILRSIGLGASMRLGLARDWDKFKLLGEYLSV